ncbi:S-4TM family putative pore-forming effector [Phenylobacterium sp.]|uniref:S-4TM family putative pore-forming effector n=1 Tax=Phenylobacterium sp. TaxID=1871053 RepID=UPI0035B20366
MTTGATNEIGRLQNEEPQLRVCMATRQAFDDAMALMVWQLAITVLAPVAAAMVVAFWPAARPAAAFVGLAALALDVLFLDRRQKVVLKAAAKLAEEFDHRVLGLPWNAFVAEAHPDPEDVRAFSVRYQQRAGKGLERVRDWYPLAASRAPLHLARIICQRANLRYDAQLRRNYTRIIQAGAVVLIGLLVVTALIQNPSLETFLLGFMPAAPVINWACREYYRQRDAADGVERLVKQATDLWNEALAGACDADRCELRCREFQDAIFAHRSRAPMILPFLYDIRRLQLEDEMNAAATDFLRLYEAGAPVAKRMAEGDATA